MITRFLFLALSFSVIAPPLRAVEPPPEKDDREAALFWSSVSASGLLFITSIALYATADSYEDDIDALGSTETAKRTELSGKAETFWTAAVLAMSASTATLLFGLKHRYDADSPLAVIPATDGTPVLAYRCSF